MRTDKEIFEAIKQIKKESFFWETGVRNANTNLLILEVLMDIRRALNNLLKDNE